MLAMIWQRYDVNLGITLVNPLCYVPLLAVTAHKVARKLAMGINTPQMCPQPPPHWIGKLRFDFYPTYDRVC